MKAENKQKLSINLFFNNIRNLHIVIASIELLRLHFEVRNDSYCGIAIKAKSQFKTFNKKYIADLEKFLEGKISKIAFDPEQLKTIEKNINEIESDFASRLQLSISECIKEIIWFISFLEHEFPHHRIHPNDMTKIRSEILTTKSLFTIEG